MIPNEIVLLNLRDSISRIVDNQGFDNIEAIAHARLVGLLADKLMRMAQTSRGLLENSGRKAISLNPIDIKHVYRIHRIDIQLLKTYCLAVRPFPPTKFEIHGEVPMVRKEKKAINEAEKTTEKAKIPARKHPKPKVVDFPVFDDLSDEQLGFCCRTPPPPPVTAELLSPPSSLIPPPPTPPSLPPLINSPPEKPTVESFETETPISNYTFPDFPPFDGLQIFKADPLPSIEKPAKTEKVEKPKKKYEKPKKTPKKAEKTVVNPAKMTKKRLMQTNYERRLRLEQEASEERKKEKKHEKRRWEMEKMKLDEPDVAQNLTSIKEKNQGKFNSKKIVFKFKPGTFERIQRYGS
uniref:Transcription initiation factor TFIID subunit 3 n=1 Tax=Caenorhabditis tropicalis TaxID=1561998 RepID=A0A1I7UX88_9PELO